MSGLVLLCSLCGEPLPELTADERKALVGGGGIELRHAVCPRDAARVADEIAARAGAGRYFEARVSLVEVADGATPDDAVTVTELASFIVGERAVDFAAALRPLALQLGGRWQECEKHAPIADS